MENDKEFEETLNTDEEETSKNDEEQEEEQEEEQTDEELIKAQELAKNQKIRAEKAEAELKKLKSEKETPKNEDGYSFKDQKALLSVDEEDIERVEKFCKSEGLTPSEALKNEDLQAILESRAEKRKTAEASNTGGSRRSSNKMSDEKLIENFEKGIVSDKQENIDRLVKARMAQKKAISKQENG